MNNYAREFHLEKTTKEKHTLGRGDWVEIESPHEYNGWHKILEFYDSHGDTWGVQILHGPRKPKWRFHQQWIKNVRCMLGPFKAGDVVCPGNFNFRVREVKGCVLMSVEGGEYLAKDCYLIKPAESFEGVEAEGLIDRYQVNQLAHRIHKEHEHWWIDLKTGKRVERNKGEMLALIHSEVSESLEGVRKDLMDDHLPHRKMEEVEMADTVIRIMDYCAGHGLDLGGAMAEKLDYNRKRADHKAENRSKENGKKF